MRMDEVTYKKHVNKKLKGLSKLLSLKSTGEDLARLVKGNRMSQANADFVKSISFVTALIYPGNYDIQFELEARFRTHTNTYGSNHITEFEVLDKIIVDRVYIVLRFPEVTITNGHRDDHLIKDLFVRIPIEINNHIPPNFKRIQGARSTITTAELVSRYAHSHLVKRETMYHTRSERDDKVCHIDFHNFCTGDGDVNETTALLNSGYDPDNLSLLLFQIGQVVKWESLAGTPYTEISTIVLKEFKYQQEVDINVCKTVYGYFKDKLAKGEVPNIDWQFSNRKFKIVNNDRFEEYLRQYSTKAHSLTKNIFLYRDDALRYYIEPVIDSKILSTDSHEWIPFRNEKIFFKVEPIKESSNKDKLLYIHPKIKTYVQSRLEFQANIAKLREVGIKRLSEVSYT